MSSHAPTSGHGLHLVHAATAPRGGFHAGGIEDRLYTLVSDYLRRDNLQALPSSQRTLMTLVMRKLLASSALRSPVRSIRSFVA